MRAETSRTDCGEGQLLGVIWLLQIAAAIGKIPPTRDVEDSVAVRQRAESLGRLDRARICHSGRVSNLTFALQLESTQRGRPMLRAR